MMYRKTIEKLKDRERSILTLLPTLISTGVYQINREFVTKNFYRFRYATNKFFDRYFEEKQPLIFGKFAKNKRPISMLPTEWVYKLFCYVDEKEIDKEFVKCGFKKFKKVKYYDGEIKECFVLKKDKLYEIVKG